MKGEKKKGKKKNTKREGDKENRLEMSDLSTIIHALVSGLISMGSEVNFTATSSPKVLLHTKATWLRYMDTLQHCYMHDIPKAPIS